MRRSIGLLAPALMLAACGGGDDPAQTDADEDVGPQGEVRGGSITDAMLPTVMVQSQSPQRGGEDDSDSDEGGAADDAE